jgi:hypothetical protein
MRGFRRFVRPSHAAALLALLVSFPLRAAEPPPPSPRALALMREARAAVARLDVARARELWAQIYDFEPSTPALCQLGQLDRDLARWEDAATELSQCAKEMRAPRNAAERRRYDARRADLAAVRQHVAEIRVLPPPGVARVLVDGRELGADGRLYVAPGQHEVTVMGRDGRGARAVVKVAAGESRSVPLTFESQRPAPTAKAPAPTPAAWPAPAQSAPAPWIVGTGATVAVAFLTTGLVLRLDAGDRWDDGRRSDESVLLCKKLGLDPSPYEKEAADAYAEALTLRNVGAGALIAGATVGTATLVYLVLPRGVQIQARAGGASVTLRW